MVLQIDSGAETTQGSTHAQGYNECNKAELNMLKDCPIGNSTVPGWSSVTEALGQDTMICPPCSHFQLWKGYTKSSRP